MGAGGSLLKQDDDQDQDEQCGSDSDVHEFLRSVATSVYPPEVALNRNPSR